MALFDELRGGFRAQAAQMLRGDFRDLLHPTHAARDHFARIGNGRAAALHFLQRAQQVSEQFPELIRLVEYACDVASSGAGQSPEETPWGLTSFVVIACAECICFCIQMHVLLYTNAYAFA